MEECINYLAGNNLDERKLLNKKVLTFMQKKVKEFSEKYKIKFVISNTNNIEIAKRFIQLDRAIFGKIKYITDKESYGA